MSATRPTRHGSRGSAAVELVVFLPVALLVLFAMLYVGQLSLYRGRTHFGGEFAVDAEGDQSEAGALRGTVTETFYPGHLGELTVDETDPVPADVPETGELHEMFDDMCEVIYSTVAVGRYVISGGQVEFVVTTHQSATLSRDGQYVVGHGLRDDNVPELCTDLVQGWQLRRKADLTYAYQPDYIRVGRWPLDAVELSSVFQSSIRGDEMREVAHPPSGMNHPIDGVTTDSDMLDAGQLPHYPDFLGDEPFWEPN